MYRFLAIVILFVIGCKTDKKVKHSPELGVTNCKIFVNTDGLRLRATPGENGKEIKKLSQDEEIKDLNESSTFTSKIKLDGVWYEEPWLNIETMDGVKGWVFAGAVRFKGDTPSESTLALLEKRAKTIFGKEYFAKIAKYRELYKNASADKNIQAALKMGDSLRVDLENILLMKATVSEETGMIANLEWLDVLMPGYQASLVAEGTEYRLFKDFRQIKEKAKKTSGDADNQYVEYCMNYYSDSIEYFFGKNYMLLSDVEGASLLGEGRHYELLKGINDCEKNKLFQLEFTAFKNQLLDDIMGIYGTTYWQPLDKILAEIDKITKANFLILTKEDAIALVTRRSQFLSAKANNIVVNLRAGE